MMNKTKNHCLQNIQDPIWKKKHNKKYYKLVNKIDYVCNYRKSKLIPALLSHNENQFSFYF